jgi:hypothetical protein
LLVSGSPSDAKDSTSGFAEEGCFFHRGRKSFFGEPRYGSGVVALVAAVALAGPPKATLSTPSATVPLVLSSWCWNAHCGAPFSSSKKTASAARGSTVSVRLAFVPRHARVAIAGRQVTVTTSGRLVTWAAARGGGVTVHATGPRGWVTYVGRLKVS